MKLDLHKRWFSQAESDLKAADWNFQGEFYENVCFFSQQAIEKALKAFLYKKGEKELITHSSSALAKKAIKYNKDFDKIIDDCKDLDKYYIPTRYPDSVPEGTPHEFYQEEDAEKALKVAKKVFEFIKKVF